MDAAALAADLKGGAKSAVYLVYGSETLLREDCLAQVQAAEPKPGFQVLKFSVPESTWAQVADELYTAPFLGGRKLVVLLDEGNFVHNHRDEIAGYAAAPSASAVLVALVPSDKAPAVREGDAVRHVRCTAPRGPDLVRWVQSALQQRGKHAERDVLEHLAKHGGPTLLELSKHVELVALHAGPSPRIVLDDVAKLVRAESTHEVYELALAAAGKRPAKALEIVHALLEDGEAAQVLLWRLAWQYRKLVEARKLLDAGRRRFEVTSMLQITYYPDDFLRLVDRHSTAELLEKHGLILETDVALKSSGGDATAVLEALVLRLATDRPAARVG